MKLILSVLLLISVSGCIYPIHKTLQPKSTMVVVDNDGTPIRDAEVYLVSNAYPYGFEKSRHMVKTNEKGVANFYKIKQWRTELVFIHGSESYFWNWCVKKEGYKTNFSNYRGGSEFMQNAEFVLLFGLSEECPRNFERIAL